MAIDLRSRIKPTRLVVKSFEFDQTQDGTEALRLILENKIEVRGSNPKGGITPREYSDEVLIVGDEDISSFEQNSEEQADGTIIYEGPMKLDASAPVIFSGKVQTPGRIHLTNTTFRARSVQGRENYLRDRDAERTKYYETIEAEINKAEKATTESGD